MGKNDLKYEITNESKTVTITTENGERQIEIYRIKALKDFGYVKAGELGGFVESKTSLSHEGDCWIGGNAQVYDHSTVYENGIVEDNAQVHKYSRIYGNGIVKGNSQVYGSSIVCKNGLVSGDSRVDNSKILENSTVKDNAKVNSSLIDNSIISDNSKVIYSTVSSNSIVEGSSKICKSSEVISSIISGDAICRESKVDNSTIKDNAKIDGITVKSSVISGDTAIDKDFFVQTIENAEIKNADDLKNTNLIQEQLNNAPKVKKRFFIDMDGTLAEFKYTKNIETLYEKGYFKNLKPNTSVLSAVKTFINNNPDIEVNILSSVLSDSKYALKEKNEWLNTYLPEIPENNRIFPPCGQDKKDFIKGLNKNDFLLDDYTNNLNSWEPPATGIKLYNGINGTKGAWKNNSLSAEKSAGEICNNMEKIINNNEFVKAHAYEKEKMPTNIKKNRSTIVVNAFAGPAAGKTTCAWEIASELKKQGLCVEYVSEYAKELVWDGKTEMLDGSEKNQKILLNEQERRIKRLIGKVDVVVTDSPILLNLTYCKNPTKEFSKEILDRFNQYQNFNFFIERDTSKEFEKEGRIHNLKESQIKDKEIKTILKENKIYYGTYHHQSVKVAVSNIIKNFNNADALNKNPTDKTVNDFNNKMHLKEEFNPKTNAENNRNPIFYLQGVSNKLYVLENPVDVTSFVALEKMHDIDLNKDSKLSLGNSSDAALKQYLKDNPQIKKICFCLKNDENGNNLTKTLAEKYKLRGYEVSEKLPFAAKSYNETLAKLKKENANALKTKTEKTIPPPRGIKILPISN
jgi:Uncharacterized protein conserved in bacteria